MQSLMDHLFKVSHQRAAKQKSERQKNLAKSEIYRCFSFHLTLPPKTAIISPFTSQLHIKVISYLVEVYFIALFAVQDKEEVSGIDLFYESVTLSILQQLLSAQLFR